MSTAADTHVSVYITFPVPANVDFKSSIPRFYEITKKCNKDLIYYAYAQNGCNLMVQVLFVAFYLSEGWASLKKIYCK